MMTTIKEDYVSFETAWLLKEKGFDWECFGYYVDYKPNDVKFSLLGETNSTWEARCCSAPTHQMAMKWLREVYGLFISIGNDDLDYNWQIFDIKSRTKDLDPICLTDSYGGYKKYETACEAAIKYCLESLIK